MRALRLLGFAAALLAAGCSREVAPPARLPDEPVAAALSTNRIHVGDAVELLLRVRHGAGARVEWPRPGDEKRIVVRDHTSASESEVTSLARWSVTSYELGEHAVWTGAVAVVAADGTREERPLPPLVLQVESILPGPEADLRGPKGLAAWPRAPMTRLFLILGLVALAAALLALLVWWIARRPARAQPAPPPEPAHTKALRALAALASRTDWAKADAELFFVELSGIVRHYLEDRFELRAPEQTTEEFIRTASASRHLSLAHQQLVSQFLVECDLVKFARHRPGADNMKQALAAAYQLVRETTPTPAGAGGGA